MWTVSHLPFVIVPNDGRSPQSLENSHLYFMRRQLNQSVKSRGEAFQRLTRQSDDQIRMNMDPGSLTQPAQVLFDQDVILTAAISFIASPPKLPAPPTRRFWPATWSSTS